MVADEHERKRGVGKQAFLDDVGVSAVECACALVDKQHGAVVYQCPGDGDALLLPAGEAASVLADRGVKPERHSGEVAGKRAAGQRLFHLFVGKVLAKRYVVPYRGVEEENVLLYKAHLLPDLLGR